MTSSPTCNPVWSIRLRMYSGPRRRASTVASYRSRKLAEASVSPTRREDVARPNLLRAERFHERLSLADELDEVHVEADVGERVRDGLTDRRRTLGDGRLGQVPLPFELPGQVVSNHDSRGSESPVERHEICSPDYGDECAERSKLEHRERVEVGVLASEAGREVAGEDVGRGTDEGKRPAEHRGVRER